MMQFLFSKTPLAYFVASFWRDEAFSYLMARLPLQTLLWSTAQDANPPLYYILLKIWMSIFGTSEVALRSLSFIFFWATLYVAFLIMRDIYKLNTKKAAMYLLFFIANPLLHYYTFEARMYSMMAFVAALLFYTFMKKEYKLYACVALIAMYTHYFLIMVITYQAIFVLLTSHKTEKKHFFLPLFQSLIFYIPWITVLILAKPPIGNSFWIAASSWKDISILPAVTLIGYEKDAWPLVPFLLPLSILICGICIAGFRQHKTHPKKLHFFLLLGWSLGIPLFIFIVSFFKPVFLPRYLIFASVGLLLLLIISIEGLKNRLLQYSLIAGVMSSLLFYSSIQVLTRKKAPLKKTYHLINMEMKKNDVVYITHEYDFHPAEYYLPNKKIYLYKKGYKELPWFVGKVLISKESFRDTLPVYPQRAFIINNDGSYSIQSSQ